MLATCIFFLWILCFEELSRLAQTALLHSFSCLEQHFSHFNKHNNHQGILLKYRFWLGWSGILRWSQWDWWGITFGGKDCIVFLWMHAARSIHLVSCWWTLSLSVNFCFSHYNVMVSGFFFCIFHLFWHTVQEISRLQTEESNFWVTGFNLTNSCWVALQNGSSHWSLPAEQRNSFCSTPWLHRLLSAVSCFLYLLDIDFSIFLSILCGGYSSQYVYVC